MKRCIIFTLALLVAASVQAAHDPLKRADARAARASVLAGRRALVAQHGIQKGDDRRERIKERLKPQVMIVMVPYAVGGGGSLGDVWERGHTRRNPSGTVSWERGHFRSR